MALDIPSDEELEAQMYARLAREHGLEEPCMRCVRHRLATVAPRLGMPATFTFSYARYTFTWVKARVATYAKGAPRTFLFPDEIAKLLRGGSHDPEHIDHIPPAERERAVHLMHVNIPNVGTMPMLVEGRHRAALALREGRPLGAVVIPEHLEPRCRETPAEAQDRYAAAQRLGLLVWEVPIQYLVTRRQGRVIFGRVVCMPEVTGPTTGMFQPATNAGALAKDAARLIGPGEGPTMLSGEIGAYAAIARRATFGTHMRAGGRMVPVVPLPRMALAADPHMLEVTV